MKILLFFSLTIQFSVFAYGQFYEKDEWILKYQNGQIKEKGWRITTDTNRHFPRFATLIGLWEYWYQNGNKQLELQFDTLGHRALYINAWLTNGTQILKNGNGYYPVYIVNNIQWNINEKIVYVIKDSILTDIKVTLKNPPYIK